MKDFTKVFLLLIVAFGSYIGLALVGGHNPLILAILRIVIGTGIIIGMILIFRKNKDWSHRLPGDKEREHEEWYKKLFALSVCRAKPSWFWTDAVFICVAGTLDQSERSAVAVQ